MRLLPRKGLFDQSRILYLPVGAIAPNPNQPRQVFAPEELQALADSIRALGILQPLTVRRQPQGWELVAGERRLRAAQLLGLEQVPCLSVQADASASSLLALVENLQRQDLDFWEEARALRSILEICQISQEELARRIGKSQSAVANKLRLLRLPPEILQTLRDGGCSERHARALLRLEDPEALRRAAEEITAHRLTVAQTEQLVERLLTPPPAEKPRRTVILKDVRLFLNTLSRSVELMRSAGVDAQCQREDSEEEILLTIRIPRRGKSCPPA